MTDGRVHTPGVQADRGPRRAGLCVVLCGLVPLALACAVKEAPSGGPEDKVPPKVEFSVPRPDSTGVDPSSPIRIGFSEPMRRERVERLVSTQPPIVVRRVRWEGDAVLVIEPEGGLARDTTYVVRVKPDYRDRHDVPATQWAEFAFATGGAPLDTARIEGTVRFKREPASKAFVRGFRVARADTLDPLAARPDRETVTARDGTFALRHLPAHGGFVVMAFVDRNSNGMFDIAGDPFAVWPDTVFLLPSAPVVAKVDISVIDPNEPAVVRGRVTNESGVDTLRVTVGLFATADSTRAAFLSRCDSTGAYELGGVKPGSYALRAFVDIRADSLMGTYPCPEGPPGGCAEPGVRLPGVLEVKPGATVEPPPLVIRRREEP